MFDSIHPSALMKLDIKPLQTQYSSVLQIISSIVLLVPFGLPSGILDLYWTKCALAFFLFLVPSFIVFLFLATCARPHCAFQSTLNSFIVSHVLTTIYNRILHRQCILLWNLLFVCSVPKRKDTHVVLTGAVWFIFLYFFWKIGDPFPILSPKHGQSEAFGAWELWS